MWLALVSLPAVSRMKLSHWLTPLENDARLCLAVSSG
jgi:hypothetical protein